MSGLAMSLAFYKGRRRDNPRARLFDWLICWKTGGVYSHVELVFHADNLSCSSSIMDGGVRAKHIVHGDHWVLVPVQGDADAARAWFAAHNGEGYDVLGIVRFLLAWVPQARRRWFCSEACAAALGWPAPENVSPQSMYLHATRAIANA